MTSPDCDGLFLVSNCFGSCRTILRVKSTYKLFNVLEQKVISFRCELVSLVTPACFCFVWFFNGDRFGFFRLLADSMTIISSSTVEYPLPTKKKPFLEVKLLKCVGFYEYKRKGNNQTLDNMINSIKTLKLFCFRCFFLVKRAPNQSKFTVDVSIKKKIIYNEKFFFLHEILHSIDTNSVSAMAISSTWGLSPLPSLHLSVSLQFLFLKEKCVLSFFLSFLFFIIFERVNAQPFWMLRGPPGPRKPRRNKTMMNRQVKQNKKWTSLRVEP